MYLSRTNSCELTCSVAYEMERSDSAVDEEPTLSASLLSRRSSPPPRALLFLPAQTQAAQITNQNQYRSSQKTPPVDRRQEKLTLPHGETGARRDQNSETLTGTGESDKPRQAVESEPRRTARAGGARKRAGSGAGAMDAEMGEGAGEIGAGAARVGAGTGVGEAEAGAVPLEWLAEALRCHVRISRRGGKRVGEWLQVFSRARSPLLEKWGGGRRRRWRINERWGEVGRKQRRWLEGTGRERPGRMEARAPWPFPKKISLFVFGLLFFLVLIFQGFSS